MRIAILEGKMFNSPRRIKTEKNKEVLYFSIGTNNSYKDKNGEYVSLPMTYINLICYNEDLFDVIENVSLKKDRLTILAKFDIVEKKVNDEIVKQYYFTVIDVVVNNSDFYSKYRDLKNFFSHSKYVSTENKDDLPF